MYITAVGYHSLDREFHLGFDAHYLSAALYLCALEKPHRQ